MLASLTLVSRGAAAAVYSYVDWTEADVAAGTATGTITLPDESEVTLTFEAIQEDGSPGRLFGAQIAPGANYWSPSEPYVSLEVENPPLETDILQLQGGQNQIYTVTLSEPIKDPIMAIVSLGQSSIPTTYDFDSPFAIVSQGPGYFGGTTTALSALEGDVLEGREGHGTIQFIGTFTTFAWTVPTPEAWHGFTFAIRTTERIEPTPGAGGAGGVGGETAAGGTDSGGTNSGGADAGEAGNSGIGKAGYAAGGEAGGGNALGGAGGRVSGAAGESDGDQTSSETVGCKCGVPLAGQSLVPMTTLLALLGGAAWARRRRRHR